MSALPEDIKLVYTAATGLAIFFALFLVAAYIVYRNQQNKLLIERQLSEASLQNQILQKELETIKAVALEKQRISSDMHDDLGSSITSIKLLVHKLKNEINSAEGNILIHDLQLCLDESNLAMREMIWYLNVQNDNLTSFLIYLKNLAAKMFENSSIQFIFNNEVIEDISIDGIHRRELVMICKEIFNNALKHSSANQFIITCSNNVETLHLFFEDNGKGISNTIDSGNGLNNIKMRIKKLNGSCEMMSSEIGLTTKISVPLIKI